MKMILSVLSGLAATLLFVGTFAVAQPPAGDQPERVRPEGRGQGQARPEGRGQGQARPEGQGQGRPGFQPGGGGGFRPGQILPPMLVQRLALTAEQQEQLELLQSEVREKLDKILTDEQKTQLRAFAERGPGGPGGPGAGRGQRPDGAGPAGERRREGDGPRPERRERPERPRGAGQPDA